MAKYVIYSGLDTPNSKGSKAASQKNKNSTNAFDISAQNNAYSNTTKKPLVGTATNLDLRTKNAMPNNVYMDYILTGKDSITTIVDKLHRSLNIYEEASAQRTFSKYANYYNRFKLPTLNDAFQKGFAHVFFTRPDCNLIDEVNINRLNTEFRDDPDFGYAWNNNKDLVKQLCYSNGQDHDFMLVLSNKAASFSTSDEFINDDTYGKTYKGWQIAYGRNNVESKTAGDFNITFNDDRTLHIYQLHRLWTEYISDVYQGKKTPKENNIKDKILDYASSCYYIITAEDGETIIFWSKYYGVFPTSIPSSQFSWAHGNLIEKQPLDIKYKFSFKEDMNPEALVEFNMNARVATAKSENGIIQYIPTFDPKLGHVGTTWVGAPYIETVTNNSDPECPYTFKLRFRPA